MTFYSWPPTSLDLDKDLNKRRRMERYRPRIGYQKKTIDDPSTDLHTQEPFQIDLNTALASRTPILF